MRLLRIARTCSYFVVCWVCLESGLAFGEDKSNGIEDNQAALAASFRESYNEAEYLHVTADFQRTVAWWNASWPGKYFGRHLNAHKTTIGHKVRRMRAVLDMGKYAHKVRFFRVSESEKAPTGTALVPEFVAGMLCANGRIQEWGPFEARPEDLFHEDELNPTYKAKLHRKLMRWGVEKFRVESVSTFDGKRWLLATYEPPPFVKGSQRRMVGTYAMTIPRWVGCAMSPGFSSWIVPEGSEFIEKNAQQIEMGMLLPHDQYEIDDPGQTWFAYTPLGKESTPVQTRTLHDVVDVVTIDESTHRLMRSFQGKTAFMGDALSNFTAWDYTYGSAKVSADTFRLIFLEGAKRELIWNWIRPQ